MPADLTIFAAKYLVFIEAVIGILICVWLLYRRPRMDALRWVVTCVVMILLAYALAKVGSAVYNDPRPFTTDHTKPLISHARDNGFPSDHALLAAAIVAAVCLLSPLWSVPFAVLAILVDWARVGAGIHHVADVIASSVFVVLATLIAVAVAPVIVRALAPHMPKSWTLERVNVRQV